MATSNPKGTRAERVLAWASRKYHWLAFGHTVKMRREMDDRNTMVDDREGDLSLEDSLGETGVPFHKIPKGWG